MQPKVSVIIPVYNTENYLKQCLDSVCHQTLEELEIICINDASTDNSGEILNYYSQKDSRVKVITFEKNRGVSATRNVGIDAATGQYIGFVDSDDRIDPDFYQKLYENSEYGVDIVKGKTQLVAKDTLIQDVFVDFFDCNLRIEENKGYFFYYFYCAIYRREFITQYNIRFFEDLCYSEDLCFTTMAVGHCSSLVCVDDAVYYYVQHTLSAIHSTKKRRFLFLRSYVFAIDRMLQMANSLEMDMQVYCAQICTILMHLRFALHELELDTETETQWEEYILSNAKYPDLISRKVQENLFAYYGVNRKFIFQQLRTKVQENKRCDT